MKDKIKINQRKLELKEAFIDVYSRVVGYYRPVRNWNKGKQAEYKERKTFEGSINRKVMEEPPTSKESRECLLFVKSGCPRCVPAKKLVETLTFVHIINLDETPDKDSYIERYNLMATPTLLIIDPITTAVLERVIDINKMLDALITD